MNRPEQILVRRAVAHDPLDPTVAVTGVTAITDLPGASLVNCATDPTIAASGWTQPVKAKITSGFRTADRPDHQGVDLGAPRNTVIRAASAGRVVWAGCDPATGNCDIDGSINTAGCGWYVEIQHTGNVAARYCHMIRKPDLTIDQNVQPGDPIGAVGTSGNSTGPHLHYEVHIGVKCDNTGCTINKTNAIDPVPYMQQVGAPVG